MFSALITIISTLITIISTRISFVRTRTSFVAPVYGHPIAGINHYGPAPQYPRGPTVP